VSFQVDDINDAELKNLERIIAQQKIEEEQAKSENVQRLQKNKEMMTKIFKMQEMS
jgi:hypothetical protein